MESRNPFKWGPIVISRGRAVLKASPGCEKKLESRVDCYFAVFTSQKWQIATGVIPLDLCTVENHHKLLNNRTQPGIHSPLRFPEPATRTRITMPLYNLPIVERVPLYQVNSNGAHQYSTLKFLQLILIRILPINRVHRVVQFVRDQVVLIVVRTLDVLGQVLLQKP